jgi:hypothetical protein
MAGCGKHDGLAGNGFSTHIQASNFYPKYGPRQGNIVVSIHGKNFSKGIRVFFGEVEAHDVRVLDDTTLEANLPPGDFGQVAVRLVLEEKEAILAELFSYRAEEIDLRFQEDIGFSDYDAAYAAGDFNGDGLVDIVVASQSELSLYLKSKKGFMFNKTYQVPMALNFGAGGCSQKKPSQHSFKYSLAVLDYNRDGYFDVVLSTIEDQSLYLFAGDQELGLTAPIVSENPNLLDGCYNRYLEVVDLNHDKVDDLLIINHEGDADGWPVQPERLGRLGAILSFGGSNEETVLLEENLGCDFLHSYLYDPDRPDKIEILCHQTQEADSRRLKFIKLGFTSNNLIIEDSHQVVPHNVTGQGRYRMFNYDFEGDKKILGLYFEMESFEPYFLPYTTFRPVILSYNSYLVGLTEDSEFVCSHEDNDIPQVLAANIFGDINKELLILCPRRGQIASVVSFENRDQIAVSQNSFGLPRRGYRGPDFSNVTAQGLPLIPSLAAFDINSDQIDEFVISDPMGRNNLIYPYNVTSQGSLATVFSDLPVIPDGINHDRQLADFIVFIRPPRIYKAGIPFSSFVDINNDGCKDILYLYMDPGIVIRQSSADCKVGPRQEIIWDGFSPNIQELLIEDLNADSLSDFIVPNFNDDSLSTKLDFVLSSPEGYSYKKSILLDTAKYEHIRLMRYEPGGELEFLGYKSAGNDCTSGECYHLYDIVAFKGVLEEEGFVSQPVIAGIKIPGDLYDVVDLDRDGLLDIISSKGLVCWGISLEKCQDPREFTPLFGDKLYSGYNIEMSILYFDHNDSIEVVGINGRDAQSEWLSFYKEKPPFSRESEPTIIQGSYPSFALGRSAAVCDFLGNGKPVVAFFSDGFDSNLAYGLIPNDDNSQFEFRILGEHSQTFFSRMGCLGKNFQGIDDLVITNPIDLVYRVPNQSR